MISSQWCSQQSLQLLKKLAAFMVQEYGSLILNNELTSLILALYLIPETRFNSVLGCSGHKYVT
jgi:hypothetical protein